MTSADQPNVGRPPSGAYGEVKEKKELAQDLQPVPAKQPTGAEGAPGGGPPTTMEHRDAAPPVIPVPGEEGRPRGPEGPVGVPPALLEEMGMGDAFQQPQQNVDPAMQAMELPPDQRVIMILDLLATADEVSEDTRVWAAEARDTLLLGGG